MSALAPTPRTLPALAPAFARLREAARSEAVVLAGLAVWTVLLGALTWATWGDVTMDTGYDLLAASRTAGGDLPYVDYVYWYGPVSPLLLGGLYAATGVAIWPAVLMGGIVAIALVLGTYRLARRLVDPLPAALAAAIVAPAAVSSANNSFVLPHATGAPLGVALALGAILLLTRDVPRPVWAGTLAGLVALTRPELGVALYIGIAAWLAVRAWRRDDRRATLAMALRVAAPAVLLPLTVYGAFAGAVGLDELLWTNLYPRDFMEAAGSVIYESHAPMTVSSLATLAGRLALYAAVTGAILVAGVALDRGRRLRTLVLAGAALAALALVAALAIRADTVRFYLRHAWMWLPAGVALAALVLIVKGRRTDRGAPLLITLVLTVATVSTYASFRPYPNALHPDATPYLLPLAAPFLAWLHTRVLARDRSGAAALGAAWLAILALAAGGLVIHDARAETARVSGPGGALTATPAQAASLQRALDLIARETRPGEPILVAPQLSSLYVLADRPNPLPQLSLLPGSLPTAAAERQAADRLAGVRLAITDRTPLTLYRHGAFGTTFDRTLAARLRRDFRIVETLGATDASGRPLDIWLRRMP
jgi:hypothetical protein